MEKNDEHNKMQQLIPGLVLTSRGLKMAAHDILGQML
jgi:hypothetical protein